MSDRELIARIKGQVDASVAAAFRTLTDGSQKAGTAIEQSNKKAAASTRDLEKAQKDSQARMVAFGAAIGTMVGFLSSASRSSEESAQIQRQLQQSIENTGESYASYADEISAAGARAVQLGIDDEKAMQAIQALTESTGSARTALNQLGLAQDISAAKGMDLVTSAELVGKVLAGNTGILARYGISVDKGATSTEALAQIQAQVAGQAEAHASSLDRWKVQLDNINESVGAALGDFAPFIGMLPGLSVGFSAASAAGGAFIDVLKNSAVASKALTFALGPGGLLTAGAALAAVGVYKVWTAVDQYDEAVRRTLGPTEEFAAALETLGSTGAAQALQVQSWAVAFQKSVDDSKAIIEAYGADIAPGIENVEAALAKIGTAAGPGAAQARADTQLWIDQLDEIGISGAGPAIIVIADNLDIYDSNALKAASSTVALSGAMVQQSAVTDSLVKAMGEVAVGYEDTAAGQKLLSDIQLIATEGTIRQREHVEALLQSYKDEINTYEVVAFSIDAVADSVRKEDAAFKAASESGAKYSQSLIDGMTAQADAAHDRNVALAEGHRLINNAMYGRPADAFDYESDQQKVDDYYAAVAEGEQKRRDELSKTITLIPDLEKILHPEDIVVDLSASFAQIEKQRQAILGYADALGYMDSVAERLRPIDIGPKGGDRTTGVAAELERTGGALESVFRVAIGGSNALGAATQQVADWADELIGQPGEYAKIDDALKNHVITLGQYKQAQAAQVSIGEDNVRVQNAVTEIQVRQAPLLAKLTDAYADHVEEVSNMGVAEQLVTLGFMDATESMKVQNAVALAASAAMGELGDTGKETATSIIQGAAEADPVLKEMLESIGLITEADGEIKINFPEGDSLTGIFKGLTASVDALTRALGGVPPVTTAEIHLDDQVTSSLSGILSQLQELDGYVATTTVQTNYYTSGADINNTGNLGGRLGGVQSFANGGLVQLAEAGPELVSFRNGGSALAMNRGIYELSSGDYVHTAPATRAKMSGGGAQFTFINNGPINGFAGVEEVVSSFEAALNAHLIGIGM